MRDTILLTGANGFLGTQIARKISKKTDLNIIAMVRGDDSSTALRRLKRSWWEWPELISNLHDRIQVICGEISRTSLGLTESGYRDLVSKVTHIIHTAADLRLDAPLDELRVTNVQGTANLLKLALAIHQAKRLKRFSHVSTAYVAGCRKGKIYEEDLTDEFGFSNNYELSKYEGEQLVEKARDNLPVSVFRPGMVIGNTQSGYIKTFNTLYFPLRLYLSGRIPIIRIPIIPVKPTMPVNLIPVDFVAEAITTLTLDPRAVGLNFHLTLKTADLPTVKDLIDSVRDWAKENLAVSLPKPRFIPFPLWKLSWLRHLLKGKSVFKSLLLLSPYLSEERQYERINLPYLLPDSSYPNWREFFSHILEFAVYSGFLHRSERTVHEQVLFRLSHKNRRVNYYDVQGSARASNIIKRTAEEVRQEVINITAALKGMGINPGDRIAVIGLNSTRYLTTDLGIGLVGGVNVPLYYTSPPAEVKEILEDSGARILLVGTPNFFQHLSRLDLKIPVVSFCRPPDEENMPSGVIPWEKFLASGEEYRKKKTLNHLNSPVSLDDTATIRYTSGTTGKPKGIVFNHYNLRFMAESLASLPPWRSRFKKVRYLSFLPMNHVVEGLLATYSLYYAPAPVDVYFLEDLANLRHVLPKVRPTFFFSVPRFYEKVWEQLEVGLTGLITTNNYLRKTLGFLVRSIFLRRTGLDKCQQLIVGSAPISEKLLTNFRELGVEIHNAYGLTEAPLITMNRLGENRIGTVGQALPETKIAISEDREIMVSGPQVMCGYYNQSNSCALDGRWLRTGDLGYLTKEGYLVINGRKKEVIVTSHGKNIYPLKIETLLKGITGVTEALVVGEEKPYCTALLWVENPTQSQLSYELIRNGVKEVNCRLSHPEQIKRWAVISDRLSIDRGELTANLKLKRPTIIQGYVQVISALYSVHPGGIIPKIKGVFIDQE